MSKQRLASLELRRVDDEAEAGLLICSLPWPRCAGQALSLAGRTTYLRPLGQWHGEPILADEEADRWQAPRRLLMIADGGPAGSKAPASLHLAAAPDKLPDAGFTVEAHRFAESPEHHFYWERHALRLRYGNVTVDLALGLRTGGEVHWWEACRLVVDEQTPAATVVRMAGAIPIQLTTAADLAKVPGYNFPLLHKHNWLSGEVFARLHHNGVVEVFARHINNKYVDEGASFDDVVPVVALRVVGHEAAGNKWVGAFDGSQPVRKLGPVTLDLGEAARLATPAHPGRFDRERDWLLWQPYEGVEVFGGVCPRDVNGTAWITRAAEHKFPRGMARTLRFTLSCSDRSPRVARYIAPWWWYTHHQEVRAQSQLPIRNLYDPHLAQAGQWCRESIVKRGFEDGSVPRHTGEPIADERHEPGWEGEVPHAQFLLAWESGSPDDYHGALRSAYHFTDVVIDHADGMARMHGYAFPPTAYALPMNRAMGVIAGWLETGDPYLLSSAEQLVESAYRLHENSWPRMAVGRDACLARAAVMLYRYCNNDHFRKLAFNVAMAVVQSQRDNGSFGDQGGGAGIHMWAAYITKPWMGCLATSGVIDYLDLFPDEPALQQCVLKFARWLVQVRWSRDGYTGWSYQHDYLDGKEFHTFQNGAKQILPSATPWHQDHFARIMALAARCTGDPAFFDAYAESFETLHARGGEVHGDHSFVATVHGLNWLKQELWLAKLTATGVQLTPRRLGTKVPTDAVIVTPDGELAVRWTGATTIEAPAQVQLRMLETAIA